MVPDTGAAMPGLDFSLSRALVDDIGDEGVFVVSPSLSLSSALSALWGEETNEHEKR